jgi:hypothetical protein
VQFISSKNKFHSNFPVYLDVGPRNVSVMLFFVETALQLFNAFRMHTEVFYK